MMKKQLPSVEKLFSLAWDRTRQRFLSFFLASLMMYVLFAALAIGGFILIAVVSALGLGGGSLSVVIFVLRAFTVIALVVGMLFVAAWSSLATITTVINPEKIGVLEAYKKIKPIVLPFVWVQLLTALFFIGLIPVSAILLFIPFLIWSVWASFMVFIYLEKQKKGLENLWISKNMVSQNFWGIIGRMLLLTVTIIFFTILFSASRNATLIFLWQIINILFVGPFSVSYSYEIYLHLDKKDSAPASKVWIVASIVGFVILVLLAGTIVKTLQDKLPDIMKKQSNEQLNKEFEKKFQEEMKNQPNQKNMRPARIKWNL